MVTISVVIPWYNDFFLMETLASVLDQRRKADEIIIVNDCSTKYPEIWDDVKFMAELDDKIKLIKLPENRGIGYARDVGLRAATQEWVAYLSSDDIWKKNFLAEMELVIKRKDADVFYCNYERIDEDGNVLAVHREQPFDNMIDFRIHVWQRHNVNFSAAIFKRQALLDIDGFDTSLRIGEDYLALLKLAKQHTIKHIPAILAQYRIHPKQGTNLFLNKIPDNDKKIRLMAERYYEA